MQTKSEYASKYGLSIASRKVARNPHWSGGGAANHFKTVLRYRLGGKRRQMTIYFSQGYGIKEDPTMNLVLDALASDAVTLENAPDFQDWANELCLEADGTDSAYQSYEQCTKQTERLKRFLDDEMYEELLWETR